LQNHPARAEERQRAAPPQPQRARRLRHLVLALGTLSVVAVVAVTALSLWRAYDEATRRAEEHLLGLAQILAEQALRSTYAIDALLRAAADNARNLQGREPRAAAAELHRHLREIIAGIPAVRALALTDATGKVLVNAASFPPLPAGGDEDAVRAQRESLLLQAAPAQPFFSRPDGAHDIRVSRALNAADGRFLGVVTATVDPNFFLAAHGLQELGPNGAARLLRRDGLLLTAYPAAVAAATRNYRDSALFTEGVSAGRELLHHAGTVVPGGRISAIHLLKDYPLAITVTSSENFVLRSWYRGAALFGGLAAVAAILVALITWSLAHQLRVDEELKAAVIESEERLQAIIQSAMDAIIIADARQRIVLFNAAAEQVFRCASAKALGADIGRFIPGQWLKPPPQPAGEGAGASLRKAGEHLALTGLRADGTEFPIDASVSQVQLHDVDHFIVILRDVTERKQVEAALRDNERRYRTLFSHAMDGILLLDARGNIVDVNSSFARMHGYAVDELLRMNLGEIDTPETLTRAQERIERILAGETLGFEVEHYHRDRHVLPLDVAASAIELGGESYVLAFHRDITERKRAEQELNRSQQELRGLSKAANEALEAERRRTARELHDELGQSLTALKMDLESLRSALPPGQPELGERALAMHALLDGTIAATRRIAADLRPLMLDDLGLAAALDWLTHNFSKHTGIATDLVIDDSVAQVPEPIASALYRITQESLTNIAKYARATTAEIRLEGDGGWVELSVRDNGRGIDAADQGKRGAFGLLGIRERVSLLGGEVAITGERGRGSEVHARIPLAAAEPAA